MIEVLILVSVINLLIGYMINNRVNELKEVHYWLRKDLNQVENEVYEVKRLERFIEKYGEDARDAIKLYNDFRTDSWKIAGGENEVSS